jgi:hypothetical protein
LLGRFDVVLVGLKEGSCADGTSEGRRLGNPDDVLVDLKLGLLVGGE